MAEDDVGSINYPLLRESIHLASKFGKRRLRRCNSAPSKYCQEQQLSVPSLPLLNYTFAKFDPRKILVLLLLYLVTGTIFFYFLINQIQEKKTINGVVDSLYFCILTITTIGYGDFVPNSFASKILISVYIFLGMALVCYLLTKLANYLVEKQEVFLLQALVSIQKFGPRESLVTNNQSVFMKNNNKYSIVLLFIVLLVFLIFVGTTFLVTVEKLDIVDAFFCVISIIASLGYGDKSFSTTTGHVFAIFWISISIFYLAYFFFIIAALNTEKRQKELVKWIATKRSMIRNGDMEAANGNFIVSVAEFFQ